MKYALKEKFGNNSQTSRW